MEWLCTCRKDAQASTDRIVFISRDPDCPIHGDEE
jgi:hypothetical protein